MSKKLFSNMGGYKFLKTGDTLQEGDEAWTWRNEACTELGWVKVGYNNFGEIYYPHEFVPIRRKK